MNRGDGALETLSLKVDDGVATVTIDHPPVNLFGPTMHADLERALDLLDESQVRVVVFDSANPDFFVAHYDVAEILAEEVGPARTTPGGFNRLMSRIRTQPRVSIAKVRGAARGGGCELMLGCDLSFAAIGRAVLAFPEVALGILAAGGGTQRLPVMIGRARALEMLLGCDDVTAELAERYGLINRAVPDAELDGFVDRLARRIASHPADALTLTKRAVESARPGGTDAGFALEAQLFDQLKSDPRSRGRMKRFLAAGAQTAEGERSFESLLQACESPEDR